MRYVLSLILTLVFSLGAAPQNADNTRMTKSAQAWDAKSIKWQDIDARGTKYALLEGRRDVSGEAFTYAFFIPAGYHEHHWHSAAREWRSFKAHLRSVSGKLWTWST